MVLYKNNAAALPQNYKEKIRAYTSVSNATAKRTIPFPEHVSRIPGEDASGPFYFMFALAHFIEYQGQMFPVNYLRRDHTAPQLHPLDTGLKSLYRYMDKKAPPGPSLHSLGPVGRIYSSVHDVGEWWDTEIGKILMETPLGKELINPDIGGLSALFINDTMGGLFGKDIGYGANLLTNKSELILKPLEIDIKRLIVPNNKNAQNQVYDFLGVKFAEYEKELAQEDRLAGIIQLQYDEVLKALGCFRDYIKQTDTKKRRGAIIEIVTGMSDFVFRMKNDGFLEPNYLLEQLAKRHSRIMDIIADSNQNGYNEVDEQLLPPEEKSFRYLHTLEKTLYQRDYIKEIVENSKWQAISISQNGHPDNDNYLIIPMVKISDRTDITSKMDHTTLDHDTSNFRKGRTDIEDLVFELGEFFIGKGFDCLPLLMCGDYLVRIFNWKIATYSEHLEKETLSEDHFKRGKRIYDIMTKKMEGYAEKVTELGQRCKHPETDRNLEDVVTAEKMPLFLQPVSS